LWGTNCGGRDVVGELWGGGRIFREPSFGVKRIVEQLQLLGEQLHVVLSIRRVWVCFFYAKETSG